MANYEPDLIHRFAEHLYKRARAVVIRYATVAGLVGSGLAWAYSQLEPTGPASSWWLWGAIAAVLGGAVGSEKSLELKLRAQELLCQLEIERNTMLLTQRYHSGSRRDEERTDTD